MEPNKDIVLNNTYFLSAAMMFTTSVPESIATSGKGDQSTNCKLNHML